MDGSRNNPWGYLLALLLGALAGGVLVTVFTRAFPKMMQGMMAGMMENMRSGMEQIAGEEGITPMEMCQRMMAARQKTE